MNRMARFATEKRQLLPPAILTAWKIVLKKDTMNAFLYLIKSDSGHLKIGISNDPKSRCQDLQTGSPEKIRLVISVECRDEQSAMELEKILHEKYKGYRTNGEWFLISAETVVSDIEFALRIATVIEGVIYYSNIVEVREIVKIERAELKGVRYREASRVILEHLKDHPEDAKTNVQELARRLKMKPSTVSKYQRAFRSHQQNKEQGLS